MNTAQHQLAYQINRAAEKLDVSRSTIYRLVNDKHLTLVKVGKRASRITAKSIHDYLASRAGDNAK
ncbi:helix-turn-helix transcriptional regulator [Acidovorax sp. 22279]|jgi:excisionase family DNA binding protein|uniref:helix-turn-helix transcriptional regulator n=1 Tax=unclassified Acidovorax TaxID=2684926 RepID=UPI001781F07F|nr:helix-turn-helix domain-containing protein [Acidovorax sp. ACV02]MBD9406225.1 helix-turn-helix domain-containing protein [Acidovorax sp. ACV02]